MSIPKQAEVDSKASDILRRYGGSPEIGTNELLLRIIELLERIEYQQAGESASQRLII